MRTAARDAIVGRACVRHLGVEGTPEIEIGYALYPEWWGQGLATEIANRCIGIGRSDLGLQLLVAIIHQQHAGEPHVPYRTGERTARRSWP